MANKNSPKRMKAMARKKEIMKDMQPLTSTWADNRRVAASEDLARYKMEQQRLGSVSSFVCLCAVRKGVHLSTSSDISVVRIGLSFGTFFVSHCTIWIGTKFSTQCAQASKGSPVVRSESKGRDPVGGVCRRQIACYQHCVAVFHSFFSERVAQVTAKAHRFSPPVHGMKAAHVEAGLK